MKSIDKWIKTILISLNKVMAYRFNFFLQVIGPALVFFFVKYNLWNSIYAGNPEKLIQGYNFKEMISYHSWALVVGLLTQGHSSMNLSEEIRMGRISTYLIYPIHFWQFHTAQFLAHQIIQTFICTLTLCCLLFFHVCELPSALFFFQALQLCFIVSLFWFSLQYFAGLLAFWLEETWIIRVILQTLSVFLSGAVIPLELYPQEFVKALSYTPFPYINYYPIKIFMGESLHLFPALLTLGVWIVVIWFLNQMIWKKGLRLYTGAGM